MQKIIDQVVDPVAYEQLDQLRAGVLSAREEFEKAISTIKSYNYALKTSPSLKGVYTEMKKLAQAEKDLQNVSKDLITVNQKLARLETERQRAMEAAEKVATQRAKTETQLEKTLTQQERTQAQLNKNTQQANKGKQDEAALTRQITDEYKQMNIALSEAEKRYANLVLTGNGGSPQAKLALQEALAIRNMLNQVDKALQRNAFDARNLSRGLGNSMQQIFRELPVLAMNAQTFFLAISNNLPIFFDAIRIAKEEIKAYNADIKAGAVAAGAAAKEQALLTGATEKQAAAAGKAATAEALKNGQFQKAPSLLKLLTQNLFSYQTLLIAGVTLLTVYGGKIVDWIKNMGNANETVKMLSEEWKKLEEAQKSSFEQAGKQIGQLTTLNSVLTSTTANTKAKKGAYDQMLKIYPSYQEQIKDEYQRTGQLSGVIQQLTKDIIAAANARAYQSEIDRLAGEFLQKQLKSEQQLRDAARVRSAYNAAKNDPSSSRPTGLPMNMGGYGGGGSQKTVLQDLQEKDQQAADAYTLTLAEGAIIVQKQQELARKMQQYNTGNLTIDGVDPGKYAKNVKDKTKSEKDYTGEYVKELTLRRQALIDYLKFEYSVTGNQETRTIALQFERDLAEDIKNIRLNEAKITAVERQVIEEEYLKQDREILVGYYKDVADYKTGQLKQFEAIEKEMTAIATKEAADRKKAELDALEVRGVGIQSGIETRQRSELQKALRIYEEGSLNKEQYEEEKLRIQQQYEEEALNSAIQFNLDLLKIIGGDVSKQADVWKKIEELLKKHEEAKTKATEKGVADRAKKEEQDQRERERRMKAGARALAYIQDQITDILNRSVDNDLIEIENQSQAIEKRKDKELDAIDKTSLAEKDKADLQAQIENEASARQNELQRREIELKQRKARYDRAVAISQTIISGGRAVVAALEAGPIAGPIFAAIIGALAAVQIGKIMATPLPQYRHGRDGGKAEFALVGEAGRERVEHTDGSSYYVDKPTVTYLPEGAKVVSNAKLNEEKIQQNAISGNLVVNSQGRLQQSQAMTEEQVKRLETAFAKGQTHFSVHTDWRGAQATWLKQGTHQKWIQKNI